MNNTRSQSSIKNTPNLRTNTSSQIQKSSINQSIQNAIKRTNMERLTNIQKPTNSYSIIKNAGKTTINNPKSQTSNKTSNDTRKNQTTQKPPNQQTKNQNINKK